MTKESVCCLQHMSYLPTYVFAKRFNLQNVLNFSIIPGVTRKKFFRGQQVKKTWSKRLKPNGVAFRRLKANKEEKL